MLNWENHNKSEKSEIKYAVKVIAKEALALALTAYCVIVIVAILASLR